MVNLVEDGSEKSIEYVGGGVLEIDIDFFQEPQKAPDFKPEYLDTCRRQLVCFKVIGEFIKKLLVIHISSPAQRPETLFCFSRFQNLGYAQIYPDFQLAPSEVEGVIN